MSNLRIIKKRASIPAALVAILAMVMSVVLVPLIAAPSANAEPLPKKSLKPVAVLLHFPLTCPIP